MDPCYELVSDNVSVEDWSQFTKRLLFGFQEFPSSWSLSADVRERLQLRLQWHFFNPDLIEGLGDKRNRAWGFMKSFLCSEFPRKFRFLRGRVERENLTKWDLAFADYESLLYVSSMSKELQLEWLSNFDARVRYGEVRRVRVIKKKGLGLDSQILGVNVLMTWPEIKARYRFLLKKHHPDVGGDPIITQQIITEYERLTEKARQK